MFDQIKSLLKDSSIYGLGEFLNKGLQFLFLPLIFIYLPANDFGILEYFLTIKNIFSIILGWGIVTSIQKYASTNLSLSLIVSSSIFSMVFIDFVVSILSAIGIYFYYNQAADHDLRLAAILTILTSLLFGFRSICFGVLRLQRRPIQYLIVSFTNIFIYLIVTLVLVMYYELTYMAFLYGAVVGIFISNLIGFIYISKLIIWSYSYSLSLRMYLFGLSILSTSLCNVLLNSTSRLFLKYSGTFTDVALIGMANKLSLFVGAIALSPFSLAWLPFVNQVHRQTNFQEILKKVKTLYAFFTIGLTLIISIFSKEILSLAKDNEYLESVPLVPIISLSYLFQGLYFIYSAGIYLEGNNKQYFKIALYTTLINLMLYIFIFNYLNAFIASLITFISFLFQLLLAKKFSLGIIKISLFDRDLNVAILIFVILLFVSYSIDDKLMLNITLSIILKVFIVFLYVLTTVLSTSIRRDIDFLIKLYSKRKEKI
jgi:O-antigen/teichoic acid export membrane protein